MTPAELQSEFREKRFKPILLLHGQEPLERDRLLGLAADLVDEGMRDFNFQSLSADEDSPGEVLGLARTMPFGPPPRVVIVRGADRYSADDLALFTAYLDDPNESSCLLLCGDKPDFRLKFFKTMKERGLAVGFEPPKGRGLTAWVKEAMVRRGSALSEEAARELVDRIGPDLMELDQEVEKVYLYALGRDRIGPEDVRIASRLGHLATVFQLGDATAEQRTGQALADLNDLMMSEPAMKVLAMLVRHFRLLLKATLALEERLNQGEAAKALGVPPFVARKYLDQARDLTRAEIKKGLVRLMEANLTLMSSPAPDRLVMEGLVLDLSSLKGPGVRRRSGFEP